MISLVEVKNESAAHDGGESARELACDKEVPGAYSKPNNACYEIGEEGPSFSQ